MEIPYLKKAFDSKIMSNYRKASLSQKIRRDLLKSYILFPDQLESSKKLVTEFNFLTHEKYKSPEEIFYHSFCKDFQDDFLNTKNLNYKKANYTSSARIIVDFFNKLQSKHLILFLHGSHADGETVNYSDVDATLILKRSAFDHLIKTRSDIFAINNFLRQFDLDTHHSTFLTLEDDFYYYPESFMPVSVFEKSIRDQNNNISQIYARTSYDLSLDSFFNLSIRVLTLIKELSNFNSINLKSIISEYFMIIILYEQVSSNNFNVYLGTQGLENNGFPGYLAYFTYFNDAYNSEKVNQLYEKYKKKMQKYINMENDYLTSQMLEPILITDKNMS